MRRRREGEVEDGGGTVFYMQNWMVCAVLGDTTMAEALALRPRLDDRSGHESRGDDGLSGVHVIEDTLAVLPRNHRPRKIVTML